MKKQLFHLALAAALLAASCHSKPATDQTSGSEDQPPAVIYAAGSFGHDLHFLKQHDSVIVLSDAQGDAQLIVSPKYQAKVFTSTATGYRGQSFGWINYKAFTGPVDGHMNAYGGENRIWLGPEGGKFSLFFPKDSPMVFSNWKTPAAFDTEPWKVETANGQSVSLHKDMQLVNYAGTSLSLAIERSITILDKQAIDSLLHLSPDESVKVVGYQTVNALTNTGQQDWTATTGMPCLWMLDMFRPSPATAILVPFKDKGKGSIATTDYFGQIPPDRIKYGKNLLLFRADGKSRGKLGLNPTRAMHMAGSYDAQNKVLTLIVFDMDSSAKYLNQAWNTVKPSFSGDAVNAYNDGPLADGSQMGPFYELESVAPAAFLAHGGSMTHKHAVFHFTGDEAALDKISVQLLGVSLGDVKKAF